MGKLEKKIIIRLDGGIGNQLFQWAFCKILSEINNAELYVDSKYSNLRQNPNFPRPILLEQLGIKLPEYLDSFKRNSCLLQGVLKHIHYNTKIVQEIDMRYNSNHLRIYRSKKIHVEGFWQSPRYFDSKQNLIRSSIKLRDNELVNTIGLHVRRGDYIDFSSNSKIYINLFETGFYGRATEYMRNKYPKHKMKIFSDDIEWCKKHFDNRKFEFSSNENTIDDFLEFASCEHQVIANSTFSWWAAWLNPNKNKTVIAPKKWYHNHWDESHLLLKEWIVF